MVRPYQPTDFDQILGIYDAVKLDRSKLGNPDYEANIQKKGFLLGLETPEDIKKQIDNSYQTLVNEVDNKIIGYLIANSPANREYVDDDYKIWFKPELKGVYYHSPKSMTLEVIATDPSVNQKGIGSELYNFLESKLKSELIEHIFSVVVIAPITNCPSIVWHSKNGFNRLAGSQPKETMVGLNWYSSVLFYKKLI